MGIAVIYEFCYFYRLAADRSPNHLAEYPLSSSQPTTHLPTPAASETFLLYWVQFKATLPRRPCRIDLPKSQMQLVEQQLKIFLV